MKRSLLTFLITCWCLSIFSQTEGNERTVGKFSALLELISSNYMDSTNLPKLTETAIRALLKELDPHSVYIAPEDVEKKNEPLVGNFEGIGITYQILHDSLLVISVTEDGPSEKAGLQAGDKIVRIDGKEAIGKMLNESFVTKNLRGKKGSEVLVTVCRAGLDSLLDFRITRDKIPLNTLVACFMLDSVSGYLKFSRFAAISTKEIRTGIQKLLDQGMKNLIVDLRGNSGGYMNIAIEIADEFLSGDRMIVYTLGLHSERQDYISKGGGLFESGRLALLVDEGSASASEILAGAVQDWDRGLLIGRRTYGKGLVQKPYYLPDRSQVRLTTARYYTPTGRCIQRPYDEGTEKYFREMNRRIRHGELLNSDSIKFPDSLKYSTPSGRVVYGGGGIMPDIFMGVDSNFNSSYYNELVKKGILNEFCIQYADRNRKKVTKEFRSEKNFVAEFQVDTLLLNELTAFAEKKGLMPDTAAIRKAGKYLSFQMKALIGRTLYTASTYHLVMWNVDAVILKARESLESQKN